MIIEVTVRDELIFSNDFLIMFILTGTTRL